MAQHQLGANTIVEEDSNGDTVIRNTANNNQFKLTDLIELADDVDVSGAIDANAETISEPVVRAYFGESQTYQDYVIETVSAGTAFVDIGNALQTAVDAGAATVVLPEGQYRTDVTVTLPSSGITIKGQGSQLGANPSTIYDYKGTGTAIDGATNSTGINIKNMRFQGPDATGSSIGVDATGSIRMRSVTVSNFGTGIQTGSAAYYSNFVDCVIQVNGVGLTGGANSMRFEGGIVSQNRGRGVEITNDLRGFVFDTVAFEKNGADDGGEGLFFDGAQGGGLITGCYIEDNADGGITFGGTAATAAPVVQGNFFQHYSDRDGGQNHDIRVDQCSGAVIGTNYHFGNVSVGIDIGPNADWTRTVSERYISGPQTAVADDYPNSFTHTLRHGIGQNDGDPNVEGQWSGAVNTLEGVQVVDTTNGVLYTYRGGSWV